ncbi:hypothetical protein L6452_39813 [Arctium lappa]|uniref:Uncharacterized protein n=1 Tax=Arctium lappa TaxID=4217 RepID=A0ACB8XUH4_ARCLA|nr:hypothetical protein L6452_39813 [Arctium lappa]
MCNVLDDVRYLLGCIGTIWTFRACHNSGPSRNISAVLVSLPQLLSSDSPSPAPWSSLPDLSSHYSSLIGAFLSFIHMSFQIYVKSLESLISVP